MAGHSQDDSFREIQLNGKQLVFLFMAATVVSVVIFLCGVLVGRGVRAERGTGTEVAAASPASETQPQPQAAVAAPPPSPESDPTKAAPPSPPAEVSYPERLQSSKSPAETLKTPAGQPDKPGTERKAKADQPEKIAVVKPVDKPRPAAAPATPPAEKPAPPVKDSPVKEPVKETVPPAAASAPGTEPPGPGYVVQVAALNVRSEADAIAKRLSSKGYEAYVVSSTSGAPQVFRVRIGKFGSRREAETMAARLQKEEQFKPWVTR